MGVEQIPGRPKKCGHAVTMYTYPAWTFGGKRSHDDSTLGPGPGTILPSTFNSEGPGFGRSPAARLPPTSGPHSGGPGKAGLISTERQSPAYSFGKLLASKDLAGPGPMSYNPPNWPNNKNAACAWGPAPRPRAASAPKPIRQEENIIHKPKGPSFSTAKRIFKTEDTPGPSAYNAQCAGCCMACQTYKGHSFGLRPPLMYGKVSTKTPGPVHHVGCSTIGAATQNCETGASVRATRLLTQQLASAH